VRDALPECGEVRWGSEWSSVRPSTVSTSRYQSSRPRPESAGQRPLLSALWPTVRAGRCAQSKGPSEQGHPLPAPAGLPPNGRRVDCRCGHTNHASRRCVSALQRAPIWSDLRTALLFRVPRRDKPAAVVSRGDDARCPSVRVSRSRSMPPAAQRLEDQSMSSMLHSSVQSIRGIAPSKRMGSHT
jgi:hypothetical protein